MCIRKMCFHRWWLLISSVSEKSNHFLLTLPGNSNVGKAHQTACGEVCKLSSFAAFKAFLQDIKVDHYVHSSAISTVTIILQLHSFGRIYIRPFKGRKVSTRTNPSNLLSEYDLRP